MADADYVELRARTTFSLLEAIPSVGALADQARKLKMPALGITESGNLFSALEFCTKLRDRQIKPILGTTLVVDFADVEVSARAGAVGSSDPSGRFATIAVLAKNDQGVEDLLALSSASFTDSVEENFQAVSIEQLTAHSKNFICLTGGWSGAITSLIRSRKPELAQSRLDSLQQIYDDRLYIEIQRHGRDDESEVEAAVLRLASSANLPIVATNEPYFQGKEDFEAQQALVAMKDRTTIEALENSTVTQEHYLKSEVKMRQLFRDLPTALEASIEIAKRCTGWVQPRDYLMPSFLELADDVTSEERRKLEAEQLAIDARSGMARLLEVGVTSDRFTAQDYYARLDLELSIIAQMNFSGYFLIVADYVSWARTREIPVGPGRGSGAGSLVAWATGICDLDPMRFDLLFERFLNLERMSLPDFDIDFCQFRRDEVVRYVRDRYRNVANIITFGSLASRAVLRDVGRVMGLPYGEVDRVVRLVPSNPARPITLREALKSESGLRDAKAKDSGIARLFDMAVKLEGVFRHASTHAAGIVIGDRPLAKLLPLYRDSRSDQVSTQYSMAWAERSGLIKFDFLGLSTLTVIDGAVRLAQERGAKIDIDNLPLDDKATYDLLLTGETVGIFQLESGGIRRAITDMQPDTIEEVIALISLYRPGPMDNIPLYCSNKHGQTKAIYDTPALEPILRETHGVIVYQEQVMRIAQVLAGYSLGEADVLRRAMGKKIRSEMEGMRVRFSEGAEKNGLDSATSQKIFDLLAKFADYGFNKSHAAGYAKIVYQTAWLKTHYPLEFLVSYLNLEYRNSDRLMELVTEARRMNIKVLPASVTSSAAMFSIEGGAIRYGLAGVRGLGSGEADDLVTTRADTPFTDLSDFMYRAAPKRGTLKRLIYAGALDEFGHRRSTLIMHTDRLRSEVNLLLNERAVGQENLFGGGTAAPEVMEFDEEPEWERGYQLEMENEAYGFFLMAHPLSSFAPAIRAMDLRFWSNEAGRPRSTRSSRLAIYVSKSRIKNTASGSSMMIINVSDPFGHYEMTAFEHVVASYAPLIREGGVMVANVEVEEREDGQSVRLLSVEPFEDLIVKARCETRIAVQNDDALTELSRLLSDFTVDQSAPSAQEAAPSDRNHPDRNLVDKNLARRSVLLDLQLPEGESVTMRLPLQGVTYSELFSKLSSRPNLPLECKVRSNRRSA